MFVRLWGKETLSSEEQSQNAHDPMLSKPSEKVTLSSEEQLLKA